MKFLFPIIIIASLFAQQKKEYDIENIYLRELDKVYTKKFSDEVVNGNIYQIGSLKNNKLHGRWESYDVNGNLSVVGEFLRGKKQGKWFFWTKDKFIEVNFKNNKIQNHFEWDKAENSIVLRTN